MILVGPLRLFLSLSLEGEKKEDDKSRRSFAKSVDGHTLTSQLKYSFEKFQKGSYMYWGPSVNYFKIKAGSFYLWKPPNNVQMQKNRNSEKS